MPATSEITPASLARLIRSVAVLALPYEGQLAWLRSLGLGEPAYADELALELNDGLLLIQQVEANGWLSVEAVQAMTSVNGLMTEHAGPGHDEFWSLEGLRDSDEWAQIRGAAANALLAIR